MSVEERVRAAAQAAAGQVREIRPLNLPAVQLTRRTSPPRRRWQGWLVPLAAAAAVIVIALGLVIAHQLQNGPATPLAPHAPSPTPTQPQPTPRAPSPTPTQQLPTASDAALCDDARSAASAPLPSDVPQYFVELCKGANSTGHTGGPGRLVAADIRTGAVLGAVLAPSGQDSVSGIYGTGDDQAFVISANRATPKGPQTDWWVLRLAPGTAHPVTATKLPWTVADRPLSIAVSPDGTKVAAAVDATAPGSAGQSVNVYSLATGRVLRSWTFNGLVDALEWTGDGSALAYQGDSQTFMVHPLTAPGSDLDAGSTPLLVMRPTAGPGTACGGSSDWLVPSDGSMIVCPQSPAASLPGSTAHCKRSQVGFVRFAAGSQLPGSSPAGTDYSATDPCPSLSDSVSLWWACSDGTQVIGQVSYARHDEVGFFADDAFIPIPALGTIAPQEPWMIAF